MDRTIRAESSTSDQPVVPYHRHPFDRRFAAIFVAAFFTRGLWLVPVAMFVIGWALQFIGHWFEGKPPEFFRDWRFLFVGLRWWMAKMAGRV